MLFLYNTCVYWKIFQGFLIEEEIRQNKEKLKLEIIRQIALSRELDKHLERQRHIMNNYICNNELKDGCPSQNFNDYMDKCKCMVCLEAAIENVSASTSTCFRKLDVTEKSLQAYGTENVCCNTIPQFENNFTQSPTPKRRSISRFENDFIQATPETKDVSCQGRKPSATYQQYIEPNKNEKEKEKNTSSKSSASSNREQFLPPVIVGYIDDYSSVKSEKPANRTSRCDVYITPDKDIKCDLTTNRRKSDEFKQQKNIATEKLDKIKKQKNSMTEFKQKNVIIGKLDEFNKQKVPPTQKFDEFNKQNASITEIESRKMGNLKQGDVIKVRSRTLTGAKQEDKIERNSRALNNFKQDDTTTEMSRRTSNNLNQETTEMTNPMFNNFQQEDATTEMADQTLNSTKQDEIISEITDQTFNNLNNLLKTPLNTIEPQTVSNKNDGEDAAEMILCNIKNIIRDYMENMNVNCNKCQLEPGTSKEEKKSSSSDSNKDTNNLSPVHEKKTDFPTKCKNDGTHIDIVMQFCESNKKKRAILEIEPCFDERKCMKYTKKNCSKKKVNQCRSSSFGQMSECKLTNSIASNSSRKFSPYPLKDRSFRKSSKPNLICRSHKKPESFCKGRKCPAIKTRNRSSKVSTSSSNNSVEIIKINRRSRTPTGCEQSSSDSEVLLRNHRTCKLESSNTKKPSHKSSAYGRKKSTICTYVSNMGGYSIERSKHTGKHSRKHTVVPVRNHEYKSKKKFDHRRQKSKKEKSLNPFHETIRKYKEHGKTTESTCSLGSSNLDETTSYREIKLNGRSKYSRKASKSRKTSNTCTNASLSLEDLNYNILGKGSTKKKNETIYARSSDIPISEQWSINRFQDKDETTKLRRKKSTVQKHGNKIKTDIKYRPKEPESDTSNDEIRLIENLKTQAKEISDACAVFVSPSLEARKNKLLNSWMTYVQKLQAKGNLKASSSTLVNMKLPPSSNYIPNIDSDQRLQYLLGPKPTVSSHQFSKPNITNKVKERTFEECKKKSATEEFNNRTTVFQLRNSNKWSIFKRNKTEKEFEDPVNKPTIKPSNNKYTGLDLNKSKSEALYTESSSSSEYIIGNSLSDSTFESTSESVLDVNENNHDELIQELICPNRNHFKG